MRFDDEVTKFCKESLELREVEFYVDDKDDMRRVMEGGIETDGDKEAMVENEEMSGSTETDVECRIEIEEDIEGSNYGEGSTEKEDRQVGEGSNEKLGSEFVTIENFGNLEGRSNTEVDNEESDDLFDSDYDMVEESGDEDDDNLFDANVNTNVELSDEGSDEEPDVVAVEGHCFDESKDSDDEEKDPNYTIFNPEIIFEPSFELGMLFSSREEFKLAVQSHAIRNKRSVHFSKNAPTRVYAKCRDKRCGWKIHLTKLKNEETFQVGQYVEKHSCDSSYHVKNMKSRWLSENIRKWEEVSELGFTERSAKEEVKLEKLEAVFCLI